MGLKWYNGKSDILHVTYKEKDFSVKWPRTAGRFLPVSVFKNVSRLSLCTATVKDHSVKHPRLFTLEESIKYCENQLLDIIVIIIIIIIIISKLAQSTKNHM